KKVGEWEGYMNLIGDGDVSISTVLRLTDEYFRARDVLFKGEMDEYERRLSMYTSGQLKTEPKRPAQDHKRLIAHFKTLSEKYRYDEWADAIRYAMGIALYEQGDMNSAVKVFEDLLKNHPESDYATEISFRLGEFYFETGQYGDAMEKYRRILEKPRSAFYEKALYKLGWIHIKLDSFDQAVDMFMAVVDRRWDGKPTEGGQTEEPISCIVLSLDNFKNTEKAIAYIESKGARGYAPFIFARLGERLTDETRHGEAILTYRYFIEHFPDDPLCPFVHEKLAGLLDSTGDEEGSLKTRWAIVHMYNPLTAWHKKNYPNGSDKLDRLLSTTLVSVARKYHSIGKSGIDPGGLDKAIEGYSLFLSSFPNAPDVKEMNLLLADALFDSKRYADAAVEYEHAAKLYKQGPEFQDLVYDAFLSYEMVFQTEKGVETAMAADKLLEAYRDAVLKNPKLTLAQMRLSGMYAETGDYERARGVLLPLLDGRESADAGKMVAELYVRENNFKAAEEVYSRLADRFKKPESIERLAQVRYMLAESDLKEGRLKEAAEKFNEAFSTRQGSAIGEASLIKLGYIEMRRKDYGGLDSTIERLSKAYPGSSLTNGFIVEAGRRLEDLKPAMAAGYFEKASINAGNAGDARALAIAAVTLYEK
ncbi:MAG: tetratricopeptide repeat protein, partial [Deltaproteobacteria bacterium]